MNIQRMAERDKKCFVYYLNATGTARSFCEALHSIFIIILLVVALAAFGWLLTHMKNSLVRLSSESRLTIAICGVFSLQFQLHFIMWRLELLCIPTCTQHSILTCFRRKVQLTKSYDVPCMSKFANLFLLFIPQIFALQKLFPIFRSTSQNSCW